MKLKQIKPITLEIGLRFTFNPADHLPDDWQGAREEAVEWFRSDMAENLHNWINPRDIYGAIREAQPDPTPELLSALQECVRVLAEHTQYDDDDGSAEGNARLLGLAAIAKAEGRAE